jgi:IS5 family transposase
MMIDDFFRARLDQSIGEAGVEELLKATIDTAVQTKVVAPKEFERVIVDTIVQEKTIAHPVDSRLLEIASGKAIPTRLAAWTGLEANLCQGR